MQYPNLVHVNYVGGQKSVLMGRLAFKDRQIFFEYAPKFLQSGLELSPYKLPLQPGTRICDETLFDGLFGLFNDSLPDGWGRLLLDRKILKMGLRPDTLTPLHRLCYVGKRGMGALQYEPVALEDPLIHTHEDLDRIAEECFLVQEHEEDQFVDELLFLNGSSAGARPKILVSLVGKKEEMHFSNNKVHSFHNDWMIKFRSAQDPKDVGSIEYAYHLMALEAGLDVPEARLFNSKKCTGYFGVKRFDRQQNKFVHMHTASGLLHADHRLPSLDYSTLMKACLWLTKDVRECEKLFRLAVFNVLTQNRDDHAKNFSFLMNEKGAWSLSPAYDLVFSSGPAGEHCTMIMGEGKNPTQQHLLKLAEIAAIKLPKTLQILEEVKMAASNWEEHAKQAHVGAKSSALIQKRISEHLKDF